ncbi:cytochrome b reductase 1-like [Ctenocephalides felis]|uniref:cytochrome b reductase 1-like n=1 Tax=Ctenocephalides felis TaxID=7515 RepID=UPI000E6E2ED6|nr:cytochrome b reductase 1-like [Ctenocephalides felis]
MRSCTKTFWGNGSKSSPTTALDRPSTHKKKVIDPVSDCYTSDTRYELIFMRSHYEEDEGAWGCGNWFEYTMVTVLSSVLLVGSLALTLFWVLYYRDGFAWTEDPKKQFNLHPVLMVAGFITFSGFSILLYRVCRCCRRIYVKLLHTVFHALAIPCVVVGFLAVLDSHNLATPPLPNFYSLHSWLGCVTMGLFGIQVST